MFETKIKANALYYTKLNMHYILFHYSLIYLHTIYLLHLWYVTKIIKEEM